MLILAFSLWFVLLAAAAILAMWLVATARDSSRLGLMRRHQRKSLALEEAGAGGRELPRSSDRE
jgi:hypothetical protein